MLSMKVLENVFFIGCSPTINEEMISYIEEVLSHIKNPRSHKYLKILKENGSC